MAMTTLLNKGAHIVTIPFTSRFKLNFNAKSPPNDKPATTISSAPPEEILQSSPFVWFKDALDGYDYLVEQGYDEIVVAGLSLGLHDLHIVVHTMYNLSFVKIDLIDEHQTNCL
jgi:hypothetical protein